MAGGSGDRWTGADREAVLAAWTACGLSAAAFAPEAGVSSSTLRRWRALARAAEAAPRLVPVVLGADDRHAEPGRVEIVIGDAVVRVAPGFDEALLLRVVRALRAC